MNKNLRNKIFVTILVLMIFYAGSNFTLPGISISNFDTNGVNVFFTNNFSFFMLGITPCISANIAISLLSSGLSPAFTRWKKDENVHMNKLKIAKYLFTAIFGLLIAYIYIYNAELTNSVLFILNPKNVIFILTIGSLVSVYLAELITKKGIGHGESVIILFTILRSIIINIAMVPALARKEETVNPYLLIISCLSFVCVFALISMKFSSMKDNIDVYDENDTVGDGKSRIAVAYNSAGIMPLYLTNVIISVVAYTGGGPVIEALNDFNLIYYVSLMLLAYICSYMFISPKKRAYKMKLDGLTIPDIEPGKDTVKFLQHKVSVSSLRFIAFIIISDMILYLVSEFTILKYISIDTITFLLIGSITLQIINSLRVLSYDKKHIKSLY